MKKKKPVDMNKNLKRAINFFYCFYTWMVLFLCFVNPMSLATFMKKLLNVSATSVWLFIILSFSHRIMGKDGISSKILKLSKSVVAKPISKI
jgi:hypothetical protein